MLTATVGRVWQVQRHHSVRRLPRCFASRKGRGGRANQRLRLHQRQPVSHLRPPSTVSKLLSRLLNRVEHAESGCRYIASQGPLPHTVDDFWRMIWHHDVRIVIMACNIFEQDRLKCAKYACVVLPRLFISACLDEERLPDRCASNTRACLSTPRIMPAYSCPTAH